MVERIVVLTESNKINGRNLADMLHLFIDFTESRNIPSMFNDKVYRKPLNICTYFHEISIINWAIFFYIRTRFWLDNNETVSF